MSNSPTNLVEILSRLVEFPTVSRSYEVTTNCLDYVASQLDGSSMHIKRFTDDKFPSLVATTQATTKPKVMLQAHIDVVPAGNKTYKLIEKDGKLYGRGVYDMKFATACYIQLVKDLGTELNEYDFGIMLTSDEEVSGEHGCGMLISKQGYRAEICVLPDGGNDWQIETSSNASWIIKLTAKGKTSHGSRPWEGENAINKLIQGISEIENVFGGIKKGQCSLTVSQIEGGDAMNKTPDLATATLDMRFINNEHYEHKRAEIEAIAKQLSLKIETLGQVDCCTNDINNPHIASFIKIAERLTGQKIDQTHSFGATDYRFFAKESIPAVIIRPTGGGAHSDEEWLDAAEFLKFYEVIKAYVIETAKIA